MWNTVSFVEAVHADRTFEQCTVHCGARRRFCGPWLTSHTRSTERLKKKFVLVREMPWACSLCTFLNTDMKSKKCSICNSERTAEAIAFSDGKHKQSKEPAKFAKVEPRVEPRVIVEQPTLDEWEYEGDTKQDKDDTKQSDSNAWDDEDAVVHVSEEDWGEAAAAPAQKKKQAQKISTGPDFDAFGYAVLTKADLERYQRSIIEEGFFFLSFLFVWGE